MAAGRAGLWLRPRTCGKARPAGWMLLSDCLLNTACSFHNFFFNGERGWSRVTHGGQRASSTVGEPACSRTWLLRRSRCLSCVSGRPERGQRVPRGDCSGRRETKMRSMARKRASGSGVLSSNSEAALGDQEAVWRWENSCHLSGFWFFVENDG